MRVDSCRNARNTAVFRGNRKSCALAEEPRKPKIEPRVNREAKRLERNPWGNLGRRCDGRFPARRIAPSRPIADDMAHDGDFDWRTPCFDNEHRAADEASAPRSHACRRLTLALVPSDSPPIASDVRRRAVLRPPKPLERHAGTAIARGNRLTGSRRWTARATIVSHRYVTATRTGRRSAGEHDECRLGGADARFETGSGVSARAMCRPKCGRAARQSACNDALCGCREAAILGAGCRRFLADGRQLNGKKKPQNSRKRREA